jgi:hypothetical protein
VHEYFHPYSKGDPALVFKFLDEETSYFEDFKLYQNALNFFSSRL